MYHCLYSLSNRVIIIFENTLKILHISQKLSFVIVSCVYIYRKLLKFYSAKAVYHMLHQSCLTMHWRKASEHNKIPNLKKSYDCYQLKFDLNSMPNCKNKKQKNSCLRVYPAREGSASIQVPCFPSLFCFFILRSVDL